MYEQKSINIFKAAKIPQLSNITCGAKLPHTLCVNSTPINIQHLSQIHCK